MFVFESSIVSNVVFDIVVMQLAPYKELTNILYLSTYATFKLSSIDVSGGGGTPVDINIW